MKLSNILHVFAVIAAFQFASAAFAFTYTAGDALLIFRSPGLNDVEFDLGSVSQFLNQTNGFTLGVANWSADVVNSNYALLGGNVQFAIVATTSAASPTPASWVTDSQSLVSVSDVTSSKWTSGLASPITAVGSGGANDPQAPLGVNYDSLLPTSKFSFDYITSKNGNSPGEIPYLGGGSGIAFQVTGTVPGTVLFYQISPSSATPKPAATLIGSFTVDANANLTFQAGPLLDSALITGISDSAGTVGVSFNTKTAVKYQLLYSTNVVTSPGNWTILPNPVAGDGTPQVLYDTSPTDNARFYSVQSYP